MKKWLVLLLGIVLLFPFSDQPAPAQGSSPYDWPTLGHDNRRSNSTSVGPSGPYTKVWYRDFASEFHEGISNGFQPIIVHDQASGRDLVHIGTVSGAMYALDLNSSDVFWRYPASGQFVGGLLSSPTVENGIVYFGSLNGKVYALNATGTEKWVFNSGRQGGFSTTPAVTTDTVYIGGRDGYFYALDKNTGTKRWEYSVGQPILTSPAYDNNTVYFGAEDMRGYALSTTGSLVWRSDQLAGQSMKGYYPVLTDDKVIFRTTTDDEDGKVFWEGEQILAYAAGCTSYPAKANYDRSNAPCFNWKATASSQADYDREDQAVRDYLGGNGYGTVPGRPQYESFHTLRRTDGSKPYITPVLRTMGNGEPAVPPVVTQDGQAWVYYRSYYSDYDNPSWFIMGAFGRMDAATGKIMIRNPNEVHCNATSCNDWYATNVWTIGDEALAFSIAGNKIYTNQWSGSGTVDLTTGALESVIGGRDNFVNVLTSNATRSLPFGSVPGSDAGPQPPPIFGDKLVIQYGSVVAMMQGHLPDQTPTTPTVLPPHPKLPFVSTDLSDIAIPSTAQLEKYVWEAPEVTGTGGQDIRTKLQSEVGKLLLNGRLAPWFLTPGKSSPFFYFIDPAQTGYYLALAYPYLTSTQQAQVRSFVANDWATTSPLIGDRSALANSPYRWDDGLTYSSGQVIQSDPSRRRELYAPGPYNYCINKGCEGSPSYDYIFLRKRFDRLYDIWLYAHTTGDWSWVETNWNTIKTTKSEIDTTTDAGLLGVSFDPNNPASDVTESANRRVSALIAYTRIAQHMNDSGEVTWGKDNAIRALQARLRYVNVFRPADGSAGGAGNWDGKTNPVGRFVRTGGSTHHRHVVQYRELTPEVARLLKDYAPADVERYDNFIDTVKPMMYLQHGTKNAGGEIMYTLPHNVQGVFLSKSLLANLSGDSLRKYMDTPWVKQDFYYWERMARTIDAYGTTSWADVRSGTTPTPTPTTPSATPTATPTSTPVPRTPTPTSTPMVTPTPTATPTLRLQIANVSAGSRVPQYSKFDLTFDVLNSVATNPQWPYDENPVPGLSSKVGISVDGLFTNDSWATVITQPGFLYQDYDRQLVDGKEHLYPKGNPVWKVRFAPTEQGTYRYKIRVRDASGTTESAESSFTVTSPLPGNHGFVKVADNDKRYFELSDGTFFTGLGHNTSFDDDPQGPIHDAETQFDRYSQNGLNFFRAWMSGTTIAGSAWGPWVWFGGPGYGGYLPESGLWINPEKNPAARQYNPNSTSPYDYTFDVIYNPSSGSSRPCLFTGYTKANTPIAVKPSTTYKVSVTALVDNITGPRVASKPYGLTVKTTTSWPQGDKNTCVDVDPIASARALVPHLSGPDGWKTSEGTFTTGSSQYFLNFLEMVMDNAKPGSTAHVGEISIREVLPGGSLGPNLLIKSHANMHYDFNQKDSWDWDYILDRAAEKGIYLKLVVLEHNDRVWNFIDAKGGMSASEDNNRFYAADNTKVRRLHEYFYRYLAARWGYSTAVHSWEFNNEGDPFNSNHYDAADRLGEGMGQLSSTSTWHSYPVTEFWGNPSYPNVDYADIHAYTQSGPIYPDSNDTTNLYLQYSEWIKGQPDPQKPIVRGETGFTCPTAECDFTTDTQGIWLHKFLWSHLDDGFYYDLQWYLDGIWNPGRGINQYPVFKRFSDFVKDLPLNNGRYANVNATASNPNIRVVGQKDSTNGKAHLWIDNKTHTWQTTGSPVSGTATFSGMPQGTYTITWIDPYGDNVLSPNQITVDASGVVTLSVSNLSKDVAVKITKEGNLKEIFLSPILKLE